MKVSLIILAFLSHSLVAQTIQVEPLSNPHGIAVKDIATNDTDTIVIASKNHGLFFIESTNAPWQKIPTIGLTPFCEAIAINNKGFIVASFTKESPNDNGLSGLFLSKDFGNNWSKISDINAVNDLLFIADTIYVGGSYLDISTDLGMTWVTPNSSTPAHVYNFVKSKNGVIASSSTTVLEKANNADGLFIQENTQTNWQAVLQHSSTTVSTNNHGTILSGEISSSDLHISYNNGKLWQSLTNFPGTAITTILSLDNSIFLVATSTHLYRTDNAGKSWDTISTLPVSYNYSLASLNNGDILLGNSHGIYISKDNGINWVGLNAGLPAPKINSIKSINNTLFIATQGGGIFHTKNDGEMWQYTLQGVNKSPQVLNINQSRSGRILLGCNENSSEGKIYYSDPPFTIWSFGSLTDSPPLPINNRSILSLEPVGDRHIYAGTNGHGVWISENDGEKYQQSGLSSGYIKSINIFQNEIFVASYGQGILKSNNSGLNWELLSFGLTDLNIHCITHVGERLFAASNKNLFYSDNNGVVWETLDIGNYEINTMKSVDDKLFIGTEYNGILTVNSNLSLENITQGSFLPAIRDFDIDDLGYLLLGTKNGIFKSKKIITSMSTPKFSHTSKKRNSLSVKTYNYETKVPITIFLQEYNHINLSIYDVSGRLVNKLVYNRPYSKGSHHLNWDTRNRYGHFVSTGVYFLHLRVGKINLSRIIILYR